MVPLSLISRRKPPLGAAGCLYITSSGIFAGQNKEILTMKKGIAFCLAALAISSGAFALPEFGMSAGGGGVFDLAFSKLKPKVGGGSDTDGLYAGGGFFAFFDATYAEADVGMSFGQLKWSSDGGSDMKFNLVYLDLSLLGKYPIALSDKLSLFPLLGLGGHISVSAKHDESGDTLKNHSGDEAPTLLSSLWIKAGGGVDFFFTDAIFLRGEVLLGYQLASTYETSEDDGVGKMVDATGAFAPTVKIAVGYKFK
jgi:hypothetical protein